MVTGVEVVPAPVLTVKVALPAPAATVMLAGTLAAALSLESITCAPPVGAGPLNVAVPVEDCAPPVTVVGFSVTEESVGDAWAGKTVSEVVLVAPAYEAVIVTDVLVVTALVPTVKVALLAPPATDTLAGTVAPAAGLPLLDTLTVAPQLGTGPMIATL